MLLRSRRKLFVSDACCAAVGYAGRAAADKPPAEPKVSIEPRAQSRPDRATPARSANIRVDTTLVLIPVTVTDPLNRFVTGLEQENFQALRGQERAEACRSSRARTRRSRSASSSTPAAAWATSSQKSRQAVAQFFKTANPEDEFFLVQFNDRPELVAALHPQRWRRSRTG